MSNKELTRDIWLKFKRLPLFSSSNFSFCHKQVSFSFLFLLLQLLQQVDSSCYDDHGYLYHYHKDTVYHPHSTTVVIIIELTMLGVFLSLTHIYVPVSRPQYMHHYQSTTIYSHYQSTTLRYRHFTTIYLSLSNSTTPYHNYSVKLYQYHNHILSRSSIHTLLLLLNHSLSHILNTISLALNHNQSLVQLRSTIITQQHFNSKTKAHLNPMTPPRFK